MMTFLRVSFVAMTAAYLLSGCVAAPILVGAGAGAGAMMVTEDRRPQKQISVDAAANDRIMELFNQQGLNSDPNRIRVTVYNGVVLLVGQVPSDQNRAQAHQAAQSAPGIKNVINELTVGPAIGATTIASDSYLSTKVRTALTRTRDFKTNHLTIVVENGSVFLMGLLTEEEQRIAVSVTRNVEDVKRVVKIMETWN